MKKVIDLSTWNRREHYEFFGRMDNPFFSLVTEVDCTNAYQWAKEKQISFFAYYLFQSLQAVNQTEAFRLRIQEGKVVLFDEIHAGATIGREDGTFGFSFIPFQSEFTAFQSALTLEIKAVKSSTGLRAHKDCLRTDQIHYSTIPWHRFTAITHARNFNSDDSTPKITFGKAYLHNEKRLLPISIDVHHGLADGWHLAQYLEKFQSLLDKELMTT